MGNRRGRFFLGRWFSEWFVTLGCRRPRVSLSGRMARAIVLALLLGAGATAGARVAHAESPPAGAKPFPLRKTTIVRGRGTRYYIDGAAVIPRTAEITVQLGVTIIGINNASLDVRGGLKVHGTMGSWVVIKKVDFSPTSFPLRGLHLDMVDFHGCTFRHSEEQSIRGDVTIENSCLQRDCIFDVRLTAGFLKIMTVEFGMPCTIRSVRHKQNRKPIELEIRSSWMKEIHFSGPGMANFRHSEIRGGLTCTDVTQVMVDGCDLAGNLSFQQAPTESFKKLSLTKCNMFMDGKVVCARKAGPRTKRERVRLQKFYFGPKIGRGLQKKAEIQARIRDGADTPGRTVTIGWTKPAKRPHMLVNYTTLRDRAPPLM